MTFNDFVGIPWVQGGNELTACDCWGLVLLIYQHIYGIEINKHVGAKHEGEALAEVIEAESTNWQLVNEPQCGDVAVIYVRGTNRPEHVGVYVGNGNVLHSPGGAQRGVSCITPHKVMLRVYKRIEYFRHDEM